MHTGLGAGTRIGGASQAEYKVCEPRADRPPDSARLQSLFDNLRSVRDVTEQHADRLRASMDFILGAEPQPASTQGGNLVGNPAGMADQINDVLTQICRRLESVANEIRRLERVVG